MEFTDSSGSKVEEAKPGDDVKVKVATDAGSVVGLLSVDKSVLLLAGGNDITKTQIITELMALVKSESTCGDDDDDGGVGIFFFWYPTFGGSSTEDVLSSAGVTVATDADLRECFNYEIVFRMAAMPGRANDGPGLSPSTTGPSHTPAKRKNFPETWLWNLASSEDGSLSLDEIVPDTITSWVTTAISMHPTAGIAVTETATELTVKLPFFITAILPYSAVKGEELELRIIVNNYGDADDTCTVTIQGSADYDAKVGENDLYMTEEDLDLKAVSVAQSSGAVTTAWLKPRVVGTIQLSVSAICSSGASDAFVRDLLVKPPGYPQEKCHSKFVQIEDGGADVTHQFSIIIDGEYVDESKTVQVQVTGDVLGPSIEGLDRLVRMPYGCGEQNMVSFTPNIFVRSYLESINDLDADTAEKTEKYMQTGYQRELTYKHTDGSFSAFGNSDPSGSTWLTAFVMKCFRQASLLIEIDLDVLEQSMTWLNAQKSRSTPGMFNEPGVVLHSDMQGGSSGGITLTAFVVIAMLEDVTDVSELNSRISSLSTTITYLEESLPRVENNAYQLAIITYALQLSNSGQTETFLAKLEALQREEGGLVWWDKPIDQSKSVDDIVGSRGYYETGPSSVEMTSYALLTYLAKDDLTKAKPIAMWLTETRGSNGGFYSTQDTVLGLQSLAGYAAKVFSSTANLRVDFETNMADTFNHTITANNAIITKKHSFKPADPIDKVTVTISGEGSTIVTACTGYNVMSLPEEPTTVVTTEITKPEAGSTKANLKACISYIGEGDSGMGLTQVLLPTGFSASVDDIKRTSGDLARTEATSDGLAVYWNAITAEESCVVVSMVQESNVKAVQDSYVTGTQYYSTETGSRSFYNVQSAEVVVPTTAPATGGSSASACVMILVIAAMLLTHII